MRNIPVFSAERNDNIGDLVAQSQSIAYLTQLKIDDSDISKRKHEQLLAEASKDLSQHGLYDCKSILVSTGWNENTEVFLPHEVWNARHTIVNKPFNLEHQELNIVGHHTASRVYDFDGNLIPDDTPVDQIPSAFDIVTHNIIYAKWRDKDRQDTVDSLLAEIPQGLWYVSMEAWFPDFDYALIDNHTQATRIIQRNDKTAFLSKYLRCFKGPGEYDGATIGRVLRNISFAGSGIVSNPANPRSEFLTQAGTSLTSPVYSIMTTYVEKKKMSDTLEKQLSEAQSTIASLTKQINDSDINKFKAVAAETEKLNKELKDTLQARQVELEAVKADLETAKATSVQFEKAANENSEKAKAAEAELTQIKTEQKTLARISIVKNDLKFDDEKAKAFVEDTKALADEAFASIVKLTTPAKVEETQTSTAQKLEKTLKQAEPEKTAASVVADETETAQSKIAKDLHALMLEIKD